MKFYHADVFTSQPLSGNGLTVVFADRLLSGEEMLKIAQEFKQFETIFLTRQEEDRFRARIFTVEEELDFAGHPLLGAGAAVMQEYFEREPEKRLCFLLNKKTVFVDSVRQGESWSCRMNQGQPEFLGMPDETQRSRYLRLLNLTEENLAEGFPMEVVSTGLAYLLVPINGGLKQVRIQEDLSGPLKECGAKFAYVFDVKEPEGRTWDNKGAVEDVATGSAAGPVGAYLLKRGRLKAGEPLVLKQGRFLNRPSEITIMAEPTTGDIYVSGSVRILAWGEMNL